MLVVFSMKGWFVSGLMNDLAFGGIKLMSQRFSAFSRLSRSFCRISESACLSRARYMAVSSANNPTLDLT